MTRAAGSYQRTVHRHKQRLLVLLISALVGVEFLEAGMFVFAAAPILAVIHAAPQDFALVQMAYAVGNMLMVVLQQWMTRHLGFAGTVALMGVLAYLRWSARIVNKRPMMVAGCLCMAASAWWMSTSTLAIDAKPIALLAPLAVRGLFGVMMVLPAASLTWKALGDTHFAKGYQAKNVMRQMMVSLASAVAAVSLQNLRVSKYAALAGDVGQGADAGMQAEALFLAGQQLYLWIAGISVLAAVIVAVQKKLR